MEALGNRLLPLQTKDPGSTLSFSPYFNTTRKIYSQEDNSPIKKIAVIYPVKGDRWMNNYYRGGQCAINAQQ